MTGRTAVSVDLSEIQAPKRLAEWQKWVPILFPGLMVLSASKRPIGMMSQVQLGTMIISKVVTSDQRLQSQGYAGRNAMVGIVLQSEGLTSIAQAEKSCRLAPGEFCLIDDARPFTVGSTGLARISILRLPRKHVIGRFPALVDRVAEVFPIHQGETLILRNLLVEIVDRADGLSTGSSAALQSVIMTLLASLPPASGCDAPEPSWRITRALADIEDRLDDPTLSALDIAQAQGIGRRQLDALFASSMKSTVTLQIVERRLAQTAQDLCDPAQRLRKITDIAFAAGFTDSAHFTRAFRRRFDCSPREWRKRALS